MNINVIKSAWRRIRRPSRKTLHQIEAAGATVDYWPDYSPRSRRNAPMASPEREQWERIAKTLTAKIGRDVL